LNADSDLVFINYAKNLEDLNQASARKSNTTSKKMRNQFGKSSKLSRDDDYMRSPPKSPKENQLNYMSLVKGKSLIQTSKDIPRRSEVLNYDSI
jgi:hypothetical protein